MAVCGGMCDVHIKPFGVLLKVNLTLEGVLNSHIMGVT